MCSTAGQHNSYFPSATRALLGAARDPEVVGFALALALLLAAVLRSLSRVTTPPVMLARRLDMNFSVTRVRLTTCGKYGRE